MFFQLVICRNALIYQTNKIGRSKEKVVSENFGSQKKLAPNVKTTVVKSLSKLWRTVSLDFNWRCGFDIGTYIRYIY